MGLEGKTVLLTGATDGIGLATAQLLAAEGARLLLHGRSPERLGAAAEAIRPHPAETLLADLASLTEVRDLVEALRQRPALDAVVNNAGVGPGPRGQARQTSADGHELRWAVNVLAPFALTEWLIAAGRAPRAVVNVASVAQIVIDLDDVELEREYDGTRAYGQSKLGLIAWTFDLAERRPEVRACALHPGSLLDTKMVTEGFGYSLGKPESGAEAIHFVLAQALDHGVSGAYFDVKAVARAKAQAYNPRARQALRHHDRAAVAPFARGLDIPA
ncbi:MAG TPA: SDR family NAD(P)-dependent oxidoreductase [Vicinamibacteria bacterium]|nr:SDR family NAD(P)-dependent oxidoreductase [Vicinamibacteria bacterium]